MPRLPPCLFQQARRRSPHLATLLPICRDLASASNELRWIEEHVSLSGSADPSKRVKQLCRLRGRGVPLQYILGTQPFGQLDIKCRPGVLIPRAETEAYTCHLVDLIKSGTLTKRSGQINSGLNIVDFCTGTGCIPSLLFASLYGFVKSLDVCGVDISSKAIRLARDNVAHNVAAGHMHAPGDDQSLAFMKGDIFNDEDLYSLRKVKWDVMISNPPYVSHNVWNYGHGQIGYSVRKYEPQLALVPSSSLPLPKGWLEEDVYYSRLLYIAVILQPQVVLLEVGDEAQARRIVSLLDEYDKGKSWSVELWRDWPDLEADESKESCMSIRSKDGPGKRDVPVKGQGNIRSILIRTEHAIP